MVKVIKIKMVMISAGQPCAFTEISLKMSEIGFFKVSFGPKLLDS